MRRQQSERLRPNPRPRFHNLLSLGQVAAAPANELTRLDLRVDKNLRPFAPDVFLHHDGVRARRNWRSGKDADSFSGRDAQAAINSRRLLADQALRFPFPASASHDRVTIHG